ncbi:MAG: ABC transporter ATP-binding protein [Planctomycetota bacterium]
MNPSARAGKMPPVDPAIRVAGLSRRFGRTLALAPLDLEVERGAVCGLVGPNGSGKSTLMRLLIGLVTPTTGTVEVDGVRLAGEGRAVRERTSYAPGEIAAFGELTLEQQFRFLLRGRDRGARERAHALAERLGLPLRGRLRTFSHGMKRQALFCAALAPDVPVLLLDEPTAGLDPSKRGEVVAILREVARAGRCVLLSSHHFGEVAKCCERVVFMAKGRVVADEVTEALERRARRLLTLEFGDDAPAAALGPVVAALGVGARTSAGRVTCELADDDPISALRRLPHDAPPPRTITFGTHSLEELYRDLYGVEGL